LLEASGFVEVVEDIGNIANRVDHTAPESSYVFFQFCETLVDKQGVGRMPFGAVEKVWFIDIQRKYWSSF